MTFNFSVSDFDSYVNNRRVMLDSVSTESANSSISKSVTAGVLSESIQIQPGVAEQFKLQQSIRETFGKGSTLNFGRIADHPDFKGLVNGDLKNHFITTIFVDIKGSTALSLKYPDNLELIYNFKNAVIKSCIEVIQAFDGHVHRIMGDAVLGFFGSSTVTRPQSILDCLNAASMLTVVLENNIKPWLQGKYSCFDARDFGFRVGCNFGDDEEILWGNYGFGKVGEISPTGLPVDLAAKLQGLANKNQIMMGQGLLEYFNFPDDFTKIKSVIKNGETELREYIYPDYTKADGNLLKYKMRLLEIHKYILGLPLQLELKEFVTSTVGTTQKIIPNEKFELSAEIKEGVNSYNIYYSNSKVIKKNSSIKATLKAKNLRLNDYYKVIFYKKNHSGFQNEEILNNHLEEEIEGFDVHAGSSHSLNYFMPTKSFERCCNFKGLHYIRCDVVNRNDHVVFRDYIYVPIE